MNTKKSGESLGPSEEHVIDYYFSPEITKTFYVFGSGSGREVDGLMKSSVWKWM